MCLHNLYLFSAYPSQYQECQYLFNICMKQAHTCRLNYSPNISVYTHVRSYSICTCTSSYLITMSLNPHTAHTGSSRASDSPLLQHNQTPMSPSRSSSDSSTSVVQPQPYLYPKASAVDVKSGEPIFGEITHPDTRRIRYVPVTTERDEEGQQQGSKEGR